MANSDCILIMGSNMAESHPVGFHWAVEAQRRGATLIHVDPRFTRTSAVADVHVAIRPGTDLAFLAGMIRYVLAEERWFSEYVRHYTNAATLVSEDFAIDEDTGRFIGFDPATNSYSLAPHSWDYEMQPGPDGLPGLPVTDPTLQHPRCVLQVMRRHFDRYTPDNVAAICGCRPDDVVKVAELMSRNSGPERTSNLAFALGFTQHSTGPQTIRAASILQLLLGNVGRPGGGLTALRGHANVQGATDIPTMFNTLPNYLPMPHASAANATLDDYVANGHSSGARRGDVTDGLWKVETVQGPFATGFETAIVSLLKAWYGDAATAANEYGYQWLPKIDEDMSEMAIIEKMQRGEIDGLFLFGQNIAVSGPNAGMRRDAMRKLKWLVVLDLFETESASVWYADPKGPDPASVGTEVFLLPVAASTEKDGTMVNTERLVQWHDRVVDTPGDCRSDLWWWYRLGHRLKELYADSTRPGDAPMQHLAWDYDADVAALGAQGFSVPDGEPDAERVLREINGYQVVTGEHLGGAHELRADGTTACGSRLYAGVYPAAGTNLAKRSVGTVNDAGLAPEWGWAWPGNVRVLYNRASADPDGQPWSERKALVSWDAEASRWTGRDVAHVESDKPPTFRPALDATGMASVPGDGPFGAHFDGKGWLYAPFGMVDGPLPIHYEPVETPYTVGLVAEAHDPLTRLLADSENVMAEPGDPAYPYIATTYHLTEHFMHSRYDSWLAELQPSMFVEISPELAREVGVDNGGWVVVTSPRGAIESRALVTERMQPLVVHGQRAHVVGLVHQFGYRGEVVGASANDLTSMMLSANSDIHSAKSFVCALRAGRLSGPVATPVPTATEPQLTEPIPDTSWTAQPYGWQGHKPRKLL
jgi:formate dehydrogenase major subunit